MAKQLSTYISTKGTPKAAIVLMLPDQVHDVVPAPPEGHAHLMVFDLNGVSLRLNVPTKDTAEAQEAYDGLDAKPELRGYYIA